MILARLLLAALLLIPALVPAQTRISSPGGVGGGGGGTATSAEGVSWQGGPPPDMKILLKASSGDATIHDYNIVYSDTNTQADGSRSGIFSIGYNVAGAGSRESASDAAMFLTWESNYDPGANNLMEFHFQGIHVDGTTFRTLSHAIDRVTKFVDVSLGVDKFTLYQLGGGAVYLSASGTDMSLGTGITLTKAFNNQTFIKQKDTTGNVVRLLDLDANNYVRIGGDGNTTWLGGRLLFPSAGTSDIGSSSGERPRDIYLVGRVNTRIGTGTVYAKAGGTLFSNTTSASNGTTVETDLWNQSITAAALSNNQESIHFYYAGTIQTSINNKQLRVKFGATTCFDSTAQNPVAATNFVIHGRVIRTGAATQKCSAEMSTTAGNLFTFTGYATPAETLSGAVTLALTGQGGASTEITFEMGKIWWEAAP